MGRALGYLFWPMASRRLSVDQWLDVVQRFVGSAKVMEEAGWGGVQIHAAHGYLLAEYLSALVSLTQGSCTRCGEPTLTVDEPPSGTFARCAC